MVFQHGDTPEHFYQAFIWSNRSYQLGNTSANGLAALAIDRYLHTIGHKQLFGSQAFKSEETNDCFCMIPVEASFSDKERMDFAGFVLQDKIDWINSLNQGKQCPNLICDMQLKPTPKGFLPGFW